MSEAPELSYDVMLGYPCNIACTFCSQELDWRKGGWLPLEKVRERVFLARRRGSTRLNLLGGEATTYPRVEELIAFARKLGFRTIQFESNGLRLGEPAFARRLADSGLTDVSLSIHGTCAATHDALVRSPGAFARLLRALENCRGLGFKVSSAFVITRANYAEPVPFVREFFARGIRRFQFIYPLYTGDYLRHAEELAVRISEVLPQLEKASDLAVSLGCPAPRVHNVPPCLLPGRPEQIGDWGDVGMEVLKPDCREYVDNAEEPLYRKAYAKPCEGCSLRGRCVGIDPVYLERWGAGELRPARPSQTSS